MIRVIVWKPKAEVVARIIVGGLLMALYLLCAVHY
jgi:hypothetical protein